MKAVERPPEMEKIELVLEDVQDTDDNDNVDGNKINNKKKHTLLTLFSRKISLPKPISFNNLNGHRKAHREEKTT